MTRHQNMITQISEFGLPVFVGNSVLLFIRGYETSNLASLQLHINETFNHAPSLVNLAYPLGVVATAPLTKELVKFCNLKWLGVFSCALSILGSCFAGMSQDVEIFIFGRILMAIGSMTLYQIALSYNIQCGVPNGCPFVQAIIWTFFALGLISGPFIGGALAEAGHATWRWAFFVTIPVSVVATCLLTFGYPSLTIKPASDASKPRSARLWQSMTELCRKGDLIGSVLWILTIALLIMGLSLTMSSSEWGIGGVAMVWFLFGMCFITFIYQQISFPTNESELEQKQTDEVFMIVLFRERTIALSLLCAVFTSIGYGTTLFYTPLFITFTGNNGPIQAAIWLMPFLIFLIAATMLSGYLLVKLHYPLVFGAGSILMISGGIWQQVIPPQSINILTYTEMINAAGIGLMWQAALPISYVIMRYRYGRMPEEQRINAVALFNIAQNGGISLALVISDAIYRKLGTEINNSAIPEASFTRDAIYGILTGSKSSISFTDHPELLGIVSETARTAIIRCFGLNLAAGVLCLISALFMKFERLPLMRTTTTTK